MLLRACSAAAIVMCMQAQPPDHAADASDWVAASLSTSVRMSGDIVRGRILASTPGGEPGRCTLKLDVIEWIRGDGPSTLTISDVDRGDAQGLSSPLPALPADPVGTELVVLLEAGPAAARREITHFRVTDGQVRQVVIADGPARDMPLVRVQAAIAQLTLIDAASAANPDGPDAIAACRVGLYSGEEEVVWAAASRLASMKRLDAECRTALEAASAAQPPHGRATRAIIDRCLARLDETRPSR